MTFYERTDQGSKQSHPENSFSAPTTIVAAATDSLRTSYTRACGSPNVFVLIKDASTHMRATTIVL